MVRKLTWLQNVVNWMMDDRYKIDQSIKGPNENLKYKDYDIGTLFLSSKSDKDKFSLSFKPGSELEEYLSNNYKIDSSYNGKHSVVWFDLFDGTDHEKLMDVLKLLPDFESSLRKKYENH